MKRNRDIQKDTKNAIGRVNIRQAPMLNAKLKLDNSALEGKGKPPSLYIMPAFANKSL
jgi:hypothetical protein